MPSCVQSLSLFAKAAAGVALSIAAFALPAQAQYNPTQLREELNRNTSAIITGTPSGTYLDRKSTRLNSSHRH